MYTKSRIELIKGDITKIELDAMVNAANTSLLGGGGVDGAIHKAGGRKILEECIKIRNKQGGCPSGEAVITNAGNLKAKYVIHTVGPVWNGGDKGEFEILEKCYINTIKLAIDYNIKSLAFPCISTGVYRFPKDLAAKIAINVIKSLLDIHQQIEKVIFVCFDDENYSRYRRMLR